jgi:3D (Asp-Asp-Asp) domain-containing protein
MNNLARGGVVLILLSLFVVFMYAQTRSEIDPAIANDSHIKDVVESEVAEITTSPTPDDKNKKLVSKTVLTAKSETASASVGRSLGSFTATAYCLSGRTAMGTGVRRGIIAADPRVLRLGSRISINGGGYSGSYIVADTGGAVRGRKLDIWVPSCSEARRFGRRTVSVSILGN